LTFCPEAWLLGQGVANIGSTITPQKEWRPTKVCDARRGQSFCHVELGISARPFLAAVDQMYITKP
jgi:hypothetical protein